MTNLQGKEQIAAILAKIPDLEEQRRLLAFYAEIYGPEIEVDLDLPPKWRTDLVNGEGEPIAAPPSFDVFVTAKEFLAQPRLTPRQDAFLRRFMDYDPGRLFRRRKSIHTGIALWGKGSGKDWLSSIVLAYVCFVVNCMADPWTYFDHAPGDQFDVMNIATNASQATSVFFNKLKARLRKKCFKQFAPGITADVITFMRQATEGEAPIILLQCHSLHAQNESWEGKSLIFWIMDEADAFQDKSGNSNADACYKTLLSSAGSRFGSRYLGLIISFRRVADGFMDRMEAIAASEGDQYIFDTGATWEIRPDKSRNDPEIAAHYRMDPLDAACKYENIAPPTIGGFFTIPERIDACVDHNREPICDVVSWESVQVLPTIGKRSSFVARRLENWRLDDDATRRTYFIHGDPGHTNASFAIALYHVETNRSVARGLDLSEDAAYVGDELLDSKGEPMPRRRVVYFGNKGTRVASAITDRLGRHTVWLTPGIYAYAYYDANGLMIRDEKDLAVSAGSEMLIEDTASEFNESMGMNARSRVVFPVVEDLLIEWQPMEGKPVDYANVEEVLAEICSRLSVAQVSFDKFNSVSLVQNLGAKGINAVDLAFSNPVQMAMFRNLRQMVNAGLVSFLPGEGESVPGRALRQLKRLRNRGNMKVEPPEGEWKDLADARAAAVHFACVMSEGLMTAVSGGQTVITVGDIMSGSKLPSASNSPLLDLMRSGTQRLR